MGKNAQSFIEEGRKSGELVPSCKHLELRLPQIEREGVTPYFTGERISEDDEKALVAFMNNYGAPGIRQFEPYCSKRDTFCIVMESPVISMQTTGGMYQQLNITMMNSSRIEKCEDREVSESVIGDGMECREFFIYRGVVRGVLSTLEKVT